MYTVIEWYFDWDIGDLVFAKVAENVSAHDAIMKAKETAKHLHKKMGEYIEIKREGGENHV